jgi:sterol desaturase/sphingolipid hydroxylase (fatty acid hydroxylase superfamily)
VTATWTLSPTWAPLALPGPSRRATVVRLAVTAVLCAVGVAIAPGDSIGVVVVLFVLVVPFERLFPRHRQPLRRPGLGTDLAYALAQPVLVVASLVAAAVVGLVSLAWVPGLLIRPAVESLPAGARALIAVLAFDVLVYWAHRASHEIGLLWRFHSIHHSSERMDWLSGIRAHPLDGIVIAPAFAFLLGAGFDETTAGAVAVVQAVVGLFLHANVRWRLRPLHRFVATPEFHHWHHARGIEANHTNYSAFLPVWDVVFGTYRMPADRRPERYGMDEPVPDGLLGQLRHPLRRHRHQPALGGVGGGSWERAALSQARHDQPS